MPAPSGGCTPCSRARRSSARSCCTWSADRSWRRSHTPGRYRAGRRGVRPGRPARAGTRSNRGVADARSPSDHRPHRARARGRRGRGRVVRQPAGGADGVLAASGTVEATGITVAPEVSGRVAEVTVAEGDTVAQGDALVRLDATLLEAQRARRKRSRHGARGRRRGGGSDRHGACEPGRRRCGSLGRAGRRRATPARAGPAGLRGRPGRLCGSLRVEKDSPAGITAKAQRDNAKAAVATARAQYELAVAGARPEQLAIAESQVEAAEAQADAARTQVDTAEAALAVLDAQLGRLALAAPVRRHRPHPDRSSRARSSCPVPRCWSWPTSST